MMVWRGEAVLGPSSIIRQDDDRREEAAVARAIPNADAEIDAGPGWDDDPPDVPLLGAERIGGDDGFPPAYILSPVKSRRQYNEAVRKYMGMSTEEFVCRWDAGEWHELYDDREHWWVGSLVDTRPD